MICLDELGPESAKSYRGTAVIRLDPTGEHRGCANQEADYGRRNSGSVFGAFQPATGAALTAPYGGRAIANPHEFATQAVRIIKDKLGDHLVEGIEYQKINE